MSWVLLSLRKMELQRTHADYVAEDLQITRYERQMARRYNYDQTVIRNNQQEKLNESKQAYNSSRSEIYDKISSIKQALAQDETASASTYTDAEGKTIDDYYTELNDLKEDYEYNTNSEKTYWEDELA